MTVKAYPSEARTDVIRWLDENGPDRQHNHPFNEENIVLIGNAVEAAAADGNWTRTFPNTESNFDTQGLAYDLAPHLDDIDSLPAFIGAMFTSTFIAAVAAQLGYRRN